MDEGELEFKECTVCSTKPGTPTLCASCLHNRRVIDILRRDRNDALEKLDIIKRLVGLRG